MQTILYAKITAFLATGKLEEAVSVLTHELPMVAARDASVQVKPRTYATTMEALVKAGRVGEAVALWVQMTGTHCTSCWFVLCWFAVTPAMLRWQNNAPFARAYSYPLCSTPEVGVGSPHEFHVMLATALVPILRDGERALKDFQGGQRLSEDIQDRVHRGIVARFILSSLLDSLVWHHPHVPRDAMEALHAAWCSRSEAEDGFLRTEQGDAPDEEPSSLCRGSTETLRTAVANAVEGESLGMSAPARMAHHLYAPRSHMLEQGARVTNAAWTQIAKDTGVCNATGIRLQLIGLTNREMKHIVQDLGRRKYTKLDSMQRWLREHECLQNFTVIVDAPNIAYCRQNHKDGSFRMGQVKAVVDELQRRGEESLVIMPTKYAERTIPNQVQWTKVIALRSGSLPLLSTPSRPTPMAIQYSWCDSFHASLRVRVCPWVLLCANSRNRCR